MHFEFLVNASEASNQENSRQYEFIFSAPHNIVNESYILSTKGHIKLNLLEDFELIENKIFKINHVRVDPRIPSSEALELIKNYFLSLGSLWDSENKTAPLFILGEGKRLKFLP